MAANAFDSCFRNLGKAFAAKAAPTLWGSTFQVRAPGPSGDAGYAIQPRAIALRVSQTCTIATTMTVSGIGRATAAPSISIAPPGNSE